MRMQGKFTCFLVHHAGTVHMHMYMLMQVHVCFSLRLFTHMLIMQMETNKAQRLKPIKIPSIKRTATGISSLIT